MSEEANNTESSEQVIKGRSVFLVETTPAGIAVQTALLTEEGKLLNAPAIFPDVEYAFTQVDELKRLISAHFSQAARLGAQVAAQQAQANATPNEALADAAQDAASAPAAMANDDAQAEQEEAQGGSKTLDNIKKYVYSGLSHVANKIAPPSNTAVPAPENMPHIETLASNGLRKPRGAGKKSKSADGAGDV
ncbi:MAG: hypothetical protein RIT20_159 [Pseudomonadota bacterium]|jgi:hypothetical protein|uniref:PRTRC system protein E n=1 Tax=uncultured beta proteobacterium TaxID=86027 RepID=A0A871YDM9_9PROT|nr:hypothetical protein HULAa45C8_00003 [uncultured beta proteobacterium]